MCTGETTRSIQIANTSKVYPHVYGGNYMLLVDDQIWYGLSPCVRGKQ